MQIIKTIKIDDQMFHKYLELHILIHTSIIMGESNFTVYTFSVWKRKKSEKTWKAVSN